MKYLTRPQHLALTTLQVFIRENGYAPTHAELGNLLAVNMKTVGGFLQILKRQGYVTITPRKCRGITVNEVAA